MISCCPRSHGLRPKKLSVSVAEPPAPVRVPSQRQLARRVASVTSVANDKGDNEMILGAVHRSPGICLTAFVGHRAMYSFFSTPWFWNYYRFPFHRFFQRLLGLFVFSFLDCNLIPPLGISFLPFVARVLPIVAVLLFCLLLIQSLIIF